MTRCPYCRGESHSMIEAAEFVPIIRKDGAKVFLPFNVETHVCAGCGQSWSNRAEKMQEAIWAELKSGY